MVEVRDDGRIENGLSDAVDRNVLFGREVAFAVVLEYVGSGFWSPVIAKHDVVHRTAVHWAGADGGYSRSSIGECRLEAVDQTCSEVAVTIVDEQVGFLLFTPRIHNSYNIRAAVPIEVGQGYGCGDIRVSAVSDTIRERNEAAKASLAVAESGATVFDQIRVAV